MVYPICVTLDAVELLRSYTFVGYVVETQKHKALAECNALLKRLHRVFSRWNKNWIHHTASGF